MAENFTKRFYVENVEAWEKTLSQKRLSDRKLEVKIIEHGIILPARPAQGTWEGGVCDNDFNFIAGYERAIPPKKANIHARWACVESGYTVDRKELVKLDEDVIFDGALIGHFGHFIMECWSRLWYIIQHPELQLKIMFITTTHGGF